MNLLDFAIIALMFLFILRGIFRGFFKEIGSLAGVILGFIIANHYQPPLTAYLKAHIPAERFLPLIAFALIFAVVVILCNFLGWGMKIILKKVLLGWADRALGAGLALLKGTIIIYLFIILLTFFVPSQTSIIAESRLAPLIVASYQSMTSLISPGCYEKWRRKFFRNKKGIDEIVPQKAEKHSILDGYG